MQENVIRNVSTVTNVVMRMENTRWFKDMMTNNVGTDVKTVGKRREKIMTGRKRRKEKNIAHGNNVRTVI